MPVRFTEPPPTVYRALVEHALDMISVLDVRGDIQFESRSVEATLGYTPSERIARVWFDYLHPDDVARVRAAFERTLTGLESTPLLLHRVRHRDGSCRVLESVGRRIVRDGATIGIFHSRDVTDREHLDARLRQAQKLNTLGRLIVAIAHDFEHVTTTMLGHIRSLLESADPAEPVSHGLGAIRKASETAASLTRQLLSFSRMTKAVPEPVDVNLLLGDVTPMLERLVGKAVWFNVTLHAERSIVRADRGQLEQVLMNLILNARDSMPEGGVLAIRTRNVSLSGDVRDTEGGTLVDHIVIEVTDTGSGLPPDARAKMFEPFFTTRASGDVSGLGLVVMYEIVQQSGGFIEIDSAEAWGTMFRVYLPVDEVEEIL